MRHRVAGLRLSRPTAHRLALFSNLVAALFQNERIKTTAAKARETRRLAERTITWARRVGDILRKAKETRTPEESARVVHAVRMARRIVRDRSAVVKLFDELAPRFAARRGGYTRILKIGQRPGDAAPMSLLELVTDDAPASTQTAKDGEKGAKAPKKAKAAEGEAKAKSGEAKAKSKAKSSAKAEGAGEKAKPSKKKSEG